MLLYKIIFLTFLFFIPSLVSASLSVSEIYPAPVTGDHEWVEVVNGSETAIDLEQYYLIDAAGKKIFFHQRKLEPFNYAIATSSGILNNTDETVTLMKSSEIVEVISYSKSFDSTSSYVRCANEWKVSKIISKLASNNDACIVPTPTPTPTPTPKLNAPTPENTSTPKDKIINVEISEFYPYPESGEEEWVELKNNNDFAVTLEKWKLDDRASSGGKPYEFTVTINAKSYEVIELPTGIFNNSSDTIRLVDSNDNEIETNSYSGSRRSLSFGKISGSFCLQNQSKGKENNQCILSSSAVASLVTAAPKIDKSELSQKPIIKGSSQKKPEVLGTYVSTPVSLTRNNHNFHYTQLPSNVSPTVLMVMRTLAVISICMSVLALLILCFKLVKRNQMFLHPEPDDLYTLV